MNNQDLLNKLLEPETPELEPDVQQDSDVHSEPEAGAPTAEEQDGNTESQGQETELENHSWRALPVERKQLIRLAPLPADRETGLRPLLFGSLGRVSRHSENLSMLKLVVEFSQHKPGKGVNELEVWIDHSKKLIEFLPKDGFSTEPSNRGLGRFMLAIAARWIQQKCAHYTVQSMPLLTKKIPNDHARLRRDYALQAQGFTVTYDDAVQMRGTCSAARASQLHTDWNAEKIRIINTSEAAEILQSADKSIRQHEAELKKVKQQLELLRRDDNTLRFTISMLVIFAVFQAALLIWMATR